MAGGTKSLLGETQATVSSSQTCWDTAEQTNQAIYPTTDPSRCRLTSPPCSTSSRCGRRSLLGMTGERLRFGGSPFISQSGSSHLCGTCSITVPGRLHYSNAVKHVRALLSTYMSLEGHRREGVRELWLPALFRRPSSTKEIEDNVRVRISIRNKLPTHRYISLKTSWRSFMLAPTVYSPSRGLVSFKTYSCINRIRLTSRRPC